jgi:hypothetical protein
MLLTTHSIHVFYDLFRSVRDHIKGLKEFSVLEDEKDREEAFYEYVDELYDKEKERIREKRLEASNLFYNILDSMPGIDVDTTWKQVRETVLESENTKNHELLKTTMDRLDMLTVFEDFIRDRHRTFVDECRQEREMTRRVERRNRETFKSALQDLANERKLHALMTWSDVYRLIRDDERYLSMLGQSGSTPVDLFHDVLDVLKNDYEAAREALFEVFDNAGINPGQLNFREFMERSRHLTTDEATLELIYREIHGDKESIVPILPEPSLPDRSTVEMYPTIGPAEMMHVNSEEVREEFRSSLEIFLQQQPFEVVPTWDEVIY